MKNFLIQTIKKAGQILTDYFQKDKKLLKIRKFNKEIVTRYDKLIDKFLIKKISQRFPNHNFLTEESGFKNRNSDFTWLIDSLDGTSNFAAGNPLFSISIALMKNKKLIFGIIYSPIIDELYFAERGKGSFLNRKKIIVSQTKEIKKSYLYFCEGSESNRKRTGRIIEKIYPKVIELRKLGSAALECAWVAAGKGEGYITTKINPWDVGAGVLIVEEAGGKVTDFKGKSWQPLKTDFVASNKKIHFSLLKLVKNL
ncbi:MAG: inositol monophosphatase family protein [Patescibacteria group bacterium]